MARRSSFLRPLAAAVPLPLLAGGCDLVVMNPAGDVARQEADLILWSTGLMLLIIVPVMILTVVFARRYRAGNEESEYAPDWDHSTGLELVIWAGPLLIVIALGALTWLATHTLDPYRPLARIAAGKPLPKDERPLEVQVVALDWKWLFIYPEQRVATVNELVVPVDRQVRFRLTSSSVMNTFYVPAMAGMIYTMPGMETKLHAVLNHPGRFEGFSANYSGAGFSGMRFWTYATDAEGFSQWVARTRASTRRLDQRTYLALERPSESVAPIHFGGVDPALFGQAVMMCVRPGTPCGAMGHSAPPPADAGEGALLRAPEEKGDSPHLTAPRGRPSGSERRADDANRNMTSLDPARVPLAPRRAGA